MKDLQTLSSISILAKLYGLPSGKRLHNELENHHV